MDTAQSKTSTTLAAPSRVTPTREEEACINGESRYHQAFYYFSISNVFQKSGYLDVDPVTGTGPHTHSYYELVYIYDGHPTNEINGKPYPCAPGDLFLMNTHLTHQLIGRDFFPVSITLTREDILSAMRYATRWDTHQPYTLDESPILRFMQFNAADGPYSAIEHSHLLFRAVPSAHSDGFGDWLRSRFDEYASTLIIMPPGWRFELFSILSHVFSSIQDTRYFDCIDVTETPSKTRQLYYDVLRQMELTHGNVTRAELAARLLYSENHIADVVREHCGLTIRQLSHSFVMQEARHLLRDTDTSIEEVAEQVGFSSKSGFYHSFKEYFGCTPAQYREGSFASNNTLPA